MTAGGSEEKITKAKKLLINGFIGLAIIMSSYAIVTFLFRAILEGADGSGGPSTASPLTSLYGGGRGTGALGSGIIDYHYPEAGQVDVPRNTKISITLKKPLVLSTIIRDYYDNETYTTIEVRLSLHVQQLRDPRGGRGHKEALIKAQLDRSEALQSAKIKGSQKLAKAQQKIGLGPRDDD